MYSTIHKCIGPYTSLVLEIFAGQALRRMKYTSVKTLHNLIEGFRPLFMHGEVTEFLKIKFLPGSIMLKMAEK